MLTLYQNLKVLEPYFRMHVKSITAIEANAFSERLRLSLKGVGVRPSPTLVANEFNLRYWGKSVTSHTTHNWLLGKSILKQDKLRLLATGFM